MFWLTYDMILCCYNSIDTVLFSFICVQQLTDFCLQREKPTLFFFWSFGVWSLEFFFKLLFISFAFNIRNKSSSGIDSSRILPQINRISKIVTRYLFVGDRIIPQNSFFDNRFHYLLFKFKYFKIKNWTGSGQLWLRLLFIW